MLLYSQIEHFIYLLTKSKLRCRREGKARGEDGAGRMDLAEAALDAGVGHGGEGHLEHATSEDSAAEQGGEEEGVLGVDDGWEHVGEELGRDSEVGGPVEGQVGSSVEEDVAEEGGGGGGGFGLVLALAARGVGHVGVAVGG